MNDSDARDAKVKVMVGQEIFEFSTHEELIINKHDLDTEMVKQAKLYAWFGVLHEKARAERVKLEADYDELYLRIDQEVRMKIDQDAKKKPTETDIKAKARTDSRLSVILRKIQRVEHDERLLEVFHDAFYQRKDLLISLARARNNEMSQPSVDELQRVKQHLGR